MTNEEALLRALNGEEMAAFQPQNNEQAYLAFALGLITDADALPEPVTIEQVLLKLYCLNGSGGLEITNAESLFANNVRLDNVGDIFPSIKNCTTYKNCFQNSTQLTSFNEKLNCAEGGADTTRMFQGCSSLAGIVDLDHAPLRTQEYMFGGCSALEGVLNVNLAGSLVYQFALQGSTSYVKPLHRFTFSPMSQYAVAVNVAYCSFTREDALEMFNSLPVSKNNHTITLTGNPCVTGTLKDGTVCDTLTEADKAIATSKGYNVVVA